MPGLTGIIARNPSPKHRADLTTMMDSLFTDDYLVTGTYVDDSSALYLGWSCHKNSYSDCLPIWNSDKTKCMLFYGETFQNEASRRQEGSDSQSNSNNNARNLINLAEELGDSFYKTLNGFFHGLILDCQKKEVTIFNDRFAMQRLYYFEDQHGIAFSSEVKAILKIRPELRKLNYAALGQLLSLGCVIGEDTLYEGISTIPGASCWRIKHGMFYAKSQYFDKTTWESQQKLDQEEFYTALRETIIAILPKYTKGTPPLSVGVSLTGGLDTRIIMANMPMTDYSHPCYTFGSMYRDGFDVKVAREVAKAIRQNHTTIRVDNEFVADFPALANQAARISEGYLDIASGAVELFANKMARKIAPIRVTGSHGSEVLRGVCGFRHRIGKNNIFSAAVSKHMNDASEIFAMLQSMSRVSMAAFVEAPFFNYNRMCIEQSQIIKRTPYMDNELLELVYRAPIEAVSNDRLSIRLVNDGNPELGRIITNRGMGGADSSIINSSRQQWYELLKRAEFAYDFGMPQIFSQIDHVLAQLHFERLFSGWNGFYHFRKWFRDDLADYVEEVLLDTQTRSREYYQKGAIEKIVLGHTRKGANYAREINMALTLELAHQQLFID